MNKFRWIKAYFSPFKPPKIRGYIGKIAIGTPYFYPRRWVKVTYEEALQKATEHTQNKLNRQFGKNPLDIVDGYMGMSKTVNKKIGFDFVALGWKTKFDDYRHEWNPIWSFVFFKWQIVIMFRPEHDSHYWESWLYYELDTNKKASKEERIMECLEKAPQIWSTYRNGEKEVTNYYTKILKKKYLKLIKNETNQTNPL